MSNYTAYYFLIIGLVGYLLGYLEGRRKLRRSGTANKKGNSTYYEKGRHELEE